MKKFSRREIIKAGLAGISTLSAHSLLGNPLATAGMKIDQVTLGQTGLQVSRLALGCGNASWARQSKFTRMGLETFLQVAEYAYQRGVTFLDTADLYGTHQFIRELFKKIPRHNFQLMTKIWTLDNDWNKVVPVEETLNRFQEELGTDYFDILLLHCLVNGNWVTEKKEFMEKLSEAKANGVIKQVGVSCHDYEALKVAVSDPWVDIILARINPLEMSMDGHPDKIAALLKTAHDNGKGVIGMKIFGAGKMLTDEDRQNSLQYAIKSPDIDSITIGMENFDYVDYSVDRVMKIVKS
ncbi:MAG: aldo/keto reductase [Cyclobacteriaceae bacterium]